MTDYQYHKEALRKQRLIERKQEAIRRMDVEEQAPMTPLKTSRDCHTQQLANDRMNELQTEHAEARSSPNMCERSETRASQDIAHPPPTISSPTAASIRETSISPPDMNEIPGSEKANVVSVEQPSSIRLKTADHPSKFKWAGATTFDPHTAHYPMRPGPSNRVNILDVPRDQIYPAMYPNDYYWLDVEQDEPRRPVSQPTRFSKSGVAYDRQMHDHSREGPVRRPTNYEIRKQLYHDAKVLRDHNLVMGPMQAFSIYFDPNKMSWK